MSSPPFSMSTISPRPASCLVWRWIPVSECWSLKPLAYFGWGSEIAGPESAWIYWTGLKSRNRMSSGGLDWSVVNSLKYIGYSPSDGPSSSAIPVMAGVEFQWPTQGLRIDGRPI